MILLRFKCRSRFGTQHSFLEFDLFLLCFMRRLGVSLINNVFKKGFLLLLLIDRQFCVYSGFCVVSWQLNIWIFGPLFRYLIIFAGFCVHKLWVVLFRCLHGPSYLILDLYSRQVIILCRHNFFVWDKTPQVCPWFFIRSFTFVKVCVQGLRHFVVLILLTFLVNFVN